MSVQEIKKEVSANYSLPENSFLDGFLHLFSFETDYFKSALASIKNKSAHQALKEDWINVASDINTVYYQEIEKIDVPEQAAETV